MRIHSIAYQSDLLLLAEMGRVDERADCFVARTPENPTHVWGNFILMPEPPRAGELVKWNEVFEREFAHEPAVRHRAFAWDGVDGAEGVAGEWAALGYRVERSNLFQAEAAGLLRPAAASEDLELRPLDSDEDWQKAIDLQVLCRGGGYDADEYRDFKIRRMRGFRRLVEDDRGRWYGAFHHDRLVGDLGLFTFKGQARFHLVETHPDHRRLHVSANLVYFAAHDFMMNGDAETLIAVTEDGSAEEGLYRELGFSIAERVRGAYKRVP